MVRNIEVDMDRVWRNHFDVIKVLFETCRDPAEAVCVLKMCLYEYTCVNQRAGVFVANKAQVDAESACMVDESLERRDALKDEIRRELEEVEEDEV